MAMAEALTRITLAKPGKNNKYTRKEHLARLAILVGLGTNLRGRCSRRVGRGHNALQHHGRAFNALGLGRGARRPDLPGDIHEPPGDRHHLQCRHE
jgi:hypothetical protein